MNMKIKSPIGDLPFRPERLSIEERALVIRGSMGAWPTKITIAPSDIPETLWLMKWPLAIVALAFVLVAIS